VKYGTVGLLCGGEKRENLHVSVEVDTEKVVEMSGVKNEAARSRMDNVFPCRHQTVFQSPIIAI
jgi:hypothetical protein